MGAFTGSMKPYRETPSHGDPEAEGRLPWHELTKRGLANLVKIADKKDCYVTALGGERFQVATMRGRIVIRSGTYDQCILYLETGEIVSEADAGPAVHSRRIAWKQGRAS
jgi:hypothetical protein